MLAPPWFELPPRGYGGTEAIVAALVDQLVELGHEVTLVGSGKNRTRAQRFVQVYEEPPSALLGTPVPEVVVAAAAARAFDDLDLDLIHDHTLAGPLLARGRSIPTIVTMHGPPTGPIGDFYRTLDRTVHLVAISDAQRASNLDLNWVGMVHNAIDVPSFPFQADKDNYVLWLGRFNADKGAHLAIDAARSIGRRVVLAGKLNEPEEHKYFEREIVPRLGDKVHYAGEADGILKRQLLANAYCLAFPVQWEEPFGMVMIEAMACGTPVVATRRGSVPEVIVDGVSGIIVDDISDFAAGLILAGSISPEACRAHVVANFDLPTLAMGYHRVYRQVLEDSNRLRRSSGRRPADM
jgi:glycosyltransferase involved in cell wall biosynthesis